MATASIPAPNYDPFPPGGSHRSMTIENAALHSRAKITPWHGREVKGLPVHTLVRGRFVMRDRKLVDDTRGWGRSVQPIQHMPAPRAAACGLTR